MSQSNINLNPALAAGNTGTIGSFPEVGIPVAIILVPKGTVIPFSAMTSPSAFATYTRAKFVNDTQSSQWYAFTNLDKFTDETKKTASEDTGIFNLDVYSFPMKASFRYLRSMGNFIEANNFNNCQGSYDLFYVDSFGNWQGCRDIQGGTNGLAAYSMQQFFVPNSMLRTTSTANQYMLSVSLSDPKQTNINFSLYAAGTQADSIVTLGNAFLLDVSDVVPPAVTTTSITFTMKGGQGSIDLIKAYGSVLTAACFVGYDLTAGAAVTVSSISTGTTVVASETYNWVKLVLSAAPTSGNVVRISLAAPSVVNAVIPNFNYTSLSLNNTNGANCAVHTFA